MSGEIKWKGIWKLSLTQVVEDLTTNENFIAFQTVYYVREEY